MKFCRINLCVLRTSVHILTLIPVPIKAIFSWGWLLWFFFSREKP